MPIYISRGRFTSDAVEGMLAKPENREEAVAKLFKSVLDCVRPIMAETPQRAQATKALPQIDPLVVAACRERNPNFGKGGRAKSQPSVKPTTKPPST